MELGASRRRVTQLSKNEWRAALEEQIRAKQSQKPSRGRRTSNQDDLVPENGATEKNRGPLEPKTREKEATQSPSRGQNATESVAALEMETGVRGRRRRGPEPMSREAYLKQLEEQIAAKKQIEDETQARRRASQPSEDESTDKEKLPTVSSSPVDDFNSTNHPEVEPRVPPTSPGIPTEIASASVPPVSTRDFPMTTPVDPSALIRLVEVCEDVKQQNEELKRQLAEQNAVLSLLRSSMLEDKRPQEKTPKKMSAIPKTNHPQFITKPPSTTQERKHVTTNDNQPKSTPNKKIQHSTSSKSTPKLPALTAPSRIPPPRISRSQQSRNIQRLPQTDTLPALVQPTAVVVDDFPSQTGVQPLVNTMEGSTDHLKLPQLGCRTQANESSCTKPLPPLLRADSEPSKVKRMISTESCLDDTELESRASSMMILDGPSKLVFDLNTVSMY